MTALVPVCKLPWEITTNRYLVFAYLVIFNACKAAKSSWQTHVGKLKLVCENDSTTVGKQVSKLFAATKRTCLYICCHQFANVSANCCVVHTHHLEFAKLSLSCKGRLSCCLMQFTTRAETHFIRVILSQ